MKKRLSLWGAVVWLLAATASWGAPFVPDEPTMAYSDIRPGMRGYAKTVVRGRDVVTFPVEILDLAPQSPQPFRLILIRTWGPVIEEAGGIAAGMSGSPVYIDDKLIGAVSFAWDFSTHRLGLVTAIEDMVKIFDYPDAVPPMASTLEHRTKAPLRWDDTIRELADRAGVALPPLEARPYGTVLTASGISRRAMERLGKRLNSVVVGGSGPVVADASTPANLRPGQAVTALLVWGDVSLDASGTLSAVSDDGRFLAFGHSFKAWGAVSYPLAEGWVHSVIPSLEAPFKLMSPGRIVGLVTQDRPEGLGGYFNRFGPAISVTVDVEDRDRGVTEQRRFRMIPDVNVASMVLPDLLSGASDRILGRTGGGSARYSLTFQGGALVKPWAFEDRVWASDDVMGSVMIPLSTVISHLIQNPFVSLMPLELKLALSVSSSTERLLVERVELDTQEAAPGDEVTATVTLRPWRRAAVQRQFRLRVPDDAVGPCWVTVRGGDGLGEIDPEGMDHRLSSLEEMLNEISSSERACEVQVELEYMPVEGAPYSEFPGEARRRKMAQGSLQVFRSEYVVEGRVQAPLMVQP